MWFIWNSFTQISALPLKHSDRDWFLNPSSTVLFLGPKQKISISRILKNISENSEDLEDKISPTDFSR